MYIVPDIEASKRTSDAKDGLDVGPEEVAFIAIYILSA